MVPPEFAGGALGAVPTLFVADNGGSRGPLLARRGLGGGLTGGVLPGACPGALSRWPAVPVYRVADVLVLLIAAVQRPV